MNRKDTIISAITAFCSPCITFICCGLMVGLFAMIVVYSNINRNYSQSTCTMVDPLYTCIQESCYAKIDYVDRFGRERSVVNKRGEGCDEVGEGNCYAPGHVFSCWIDQTDPSFIVYGFNPEATKNQLVIGMIACGTVALALLVIISTCFMCMIFIMQPVDEDIEEDSAQRILREQELKRQERRIKMFNDLIPTINIPKKGELNHDFKAVCREKCTVCMENFERGDNFVALPCTHLFHADCAKDWLKKSKDVTCPLCRDNCIFEQARELKRNGIVMEELYKQANLETASNITGVGSPASPALYVPSPITPSTTTQRIQVKVAGPGPSNVASIYPRSPNQLTVPAYNAHATLGTPSKLPGQTLSPSSARTPLSAPTYVRSPLSTRTLGATGAGAQSSRTSPTSEFEVRHNSLSPLTRVSPIDEPFQPSAPEQFHAKTP